MQNGAKNSTKATLCYLKWDSYSAMLAVCTALLHISSSEAWAAIWYWWQNTTSRAVPLKEVQPWQHSMVICKSSTDWSWAVALSVNQVVVQSNKVYCWSPKWCIVEGKGTKMWCFLPTMHQILGVRDGQPPHWHFLKMAMPFNVIFHVKTSHCDCAYMLCDIRFITSFNRPPASKAHWHHCQLVYVRTLGSHPDPDCRSKWAKTYSI